MTTRRVLLALCVAALAIAEARADTWYRIEGADGQLIGRQHEWERETSEGRQRIRERDMAFRVEGHPLLIAYRADSPSAIWRLSRSRVGAIASAVQPLLGANLTFRPSDRPIGADELSAKRTVPHPMLTSPYAIPAAALAGHIRYRLHVPILELDALPATGEQRWQPIGQELRLDVCADCGPGLSTVPGDLATWRRPSRWLESDAPALRQAVSRLSPTLSDSEKMKRLSAIARARLAEVDYDGHVSALAAWHRRSGDCPEDAALLAALACAAGIPARVANGVVYSRARYHGAADAFLPHSWVIAYVDGRWRSFDISVGKFDASHVALTVGDGEPWSTAAANQLAGLIDWRDIAEVRPRPRD